MQSFPTVYSSRNMARRSLSRLNERGGAIVSSAPQIGPVRPGSAGLLLKVARDSPHLDELRQTKSRSFNTKRRAAEGREETVWLTS